jgi:hypothetical protein
VVSLKELADGGEGPSELVPESERDVPPGVDDVLKPTSAKELFSADAVRPKNLEDDQVGGGKGPESLRRPDAAEKGDARDEVVLGELADAHDPNSRTRAPQNVPPFTLW